MKIKEEDKDEVEVGEEDDVSYHENEDEDEHWDEDKDILLFFFVIFDLLYLTNNFNLIVNPYILRLFFLF